MVCIGATITLDTEYHAQPLLTVDVHCNGTFVHHQSGRSSSSTATMYRTSYYSVPDSCEPDVEDCRILDTYAGTDTAGDSAYGNT